MKADLSEVVSSLIDRFNGWRLGISVDIETVLKGVIIALIMLTLTVLQTTFFTRFRLFGAVPDLMLPFVLAVSALEREKWGSITALVAAFIIDAAGGTSVMLLPILYVPCAIAVAMLTTYRLRDALPTVAVFTVATSILRGGVTFVCAMLSVSGITASAALFDKVIPEIGANIILAAIPQVFTRLCLRPFHKTRDERTGRI